mgnify:CR=1 FL=1
MITAKGGSGAFGTQYTAIAAGSHFPGLVATEHYDGAAWSLGGLMINDRFDHGAAGSQAAALAIGGRTPTISTVTEHYDGHVWSAGGAMIIAKESHGSAGVENAALSIGGSTPSTLSNTDGFFQLAKT